MAFGNEIKQGNIVENWLFDFANDNSGYLRFAFSDVTDSSNFYHGVIIMGNKPSLRESIDLATSTAKSSNISISIPDFNYQGSPVSKELFGGSNHYINQTVAVYSKVNAGTKQQIGSFRLTDISSNGDTIQLSLSTHRPWDFLSFPQTKSTTKVYVPVVYGDFTKNTIGDGSDARFMTSKNLFPAPNAKYAINDNVYFIYPKSEGSEAIPHFYDSNLDLFIPFTDSSTATADTRLGVDTNGVYIDMEKGAFLIRPLSPSGWTSSDNAVDTSTSSEATAITSTPTATSTTRTATTTLNFDLPTIDGELIVKYLYIKATVTHNHTSGQTNSGLRVGTALVTNGSGNVFIQTTGDTGSVQTSSVSTGGYTVNSVSGYSRVDISTVSTVNINLHSTNSTNSGDDGVGNGSATLQDIVLELKSQNDISNEKLASLDKLSQLDNVYCGGDGLTESWSGSSGAITEIHEAHRDLLIRFAGLATSDPTGWSDLNSSKDWRIRYWQTEPIDLKKALEMLQYEGGFIGRFKADGTFQYIHIKDSYGSTDATLTKSDISNVNVKPSPLSELLTKMEISYRKHPAGKDYLTDVTFTNSTARTNWNIQSKENIKQVKLDAYVGDTSSDNDIPTSATTNPNDDWATYYDNIFGDIKLIVNCTIVNPKYYDLEVGDVIDFSDMHPETPYGYNSANWSGIKFMIISLNRTLGEMQITARQIT